MTGTVVLASASPRRAALMEQAGIPFTVIVADVDESAIFRDASSADPADKAISAARLKAHTVFGMMTDQSLIGLPIVACDTIVVCDGAIFGKPADREEARRMLKTLSGRTHRVISGVCILVDEVERVFSQETAVRFWNLSDADIEAYLDTGDSFDKAGSYGIQSRGVILVSSIEGDYCNVVGLPISRLVRELESLSVEAGRP